MKLVIQTQFMENYAAHNSDYKHGVDEAYWKYKGGDTFVFRNLSPAQALQIKENEIPTLRNLIEYDGEGSREYVADWSLEDDDAKECAEWETPWDLTFDSRNGWVANRFVKADEFWKPGFVGKSESYVMGPEGERIDYDCSYIEEKRVA